MGTLRTLVIGLAMFGLTATGALAQETGDNDARLGLARQIIALRVNEASDMLTFRAKLPYFSASIQQAARLTDAERAELPALLEQAYRAVRVPAREQVATTYARIFTTEQLQQLLTFYQSDTGKAFLAHQEELTAEGISLQRLSDAAVLSSTMQTIQDQRRTGAH